MNQTAQTGRKYYLYFGAIDPIHFNTAQGERARMEQIYYDTPAEARQAIKDLPKSLRKVASVEAADF